MNGQSQLDEQPAEHELEQEHTVRLGQADTFVREQGAQVDEGTVRLVLVDEESGRVALEVPLPPEPYDLVLAVQVPPEPAPPDASDPTGDGPAAFFSRVERELRARLAGAVVVGHELGQGHLVWTPQPREHLFDALARIHALAERVAEAVTGLCRGARYRDACQRLTRDLSELDRRSRRLGTAFPEARLTLVDDFGWVHRLAEYVDERDTLRVQLLQADADLWSSLLGRGLYLAMQMPGESDAGFVERFVEVVERKVGLELSESSNLEVVGDWAETDPLCLWRVVPPPGASFEWLLTATCQLARFSTSLTALARTASEALDLLGTRLDHRRPHRSPDTSARPDSAAEPPEAELEKPEPETASPAVAPSSDDAPADIAAAPAASSTDEPPPPRRQDTRFSIDRVSAREFIKKLAGEEPAEVDILLSHPGYNIAKTAKILSILLPCSKEEANAFCERAPCLLVGPVTRSRGSQLKQIIEGTGAKIRVVDSGADADSDPSDSDVKQDE